VVTCAADAALDTVVTVLAGQPVLVSVATGTVTVPDVAPGVFDARLSPDGRKVAWVRDGSLCMWSPEDGERVLISEPSPDVTWGLAEFIAAEEMGRHRGHWWSPDSRLVAACRVDVAEVPVWHIADPAHPERPAESHHYPAAGATNARVTLHIIDIDTGSPTPVDLPAGAEYLNSVSWTESGFVAQVQSRDQKRVDVVRIEPPLEAVVYDSSPATAPTNDVTFTTTTYEASSIAVGDYICTAGKSVVPQVPDVYWQVLVARTAKQWCVAKGKGQLAGILAKELQQMEENALSIVSPRVETGGPKLVPRFSFLGNVGGFGSKGIIRGG
jgi:hypothetical protein